MRVECFTHAWSGFRKDRLTMIGSAQKAPVSSAALTALNMAVVRQAVFERAAEQISERREDATQAVLQTAENNRTRNATVGAVIESNKDKKSETEALRVEPAESEFKSPDFKGVAGKALDITV